MFSADLTSFPVLLNISKLREWLQCVQVWLLKQWSSAVQATDRRSPVSWVRNEDWGKRRKPSTSACVVLGCLCIVPLLFPWHARVHQVLSFLFAFSRPVAWGEIARVTLYPLWHWVLTNLSIIAAKPWTRGRPGDLPVLGSRCVTLTWKRWTQTLLVCSLPLPSYCPVCPPVHLWVLQHPFLRVFVEDSSSDGRPPWE